MIDLDNENNNKLQLTVGGNAREFTLEVHNKYFEFTSKGLDISENLGKISKREQNGKKSSFFMISWREKEVSYIVSK